MGLLFDDAGGPFAYTHLPHSYTAPAMLRLIVRLVAQGDALLPELPQALAVDLDDARAGGRQGVLPENPAQVVE